MRNWRLRTKVVTVLVVPTVTALVLGGLRVMADLDRAAEFRQTVSQVDLAGTITNVVHQVQKERTHAVAWVAGGRQGPTTELDAQISQVDDAVEEARSATDSLETDDESITERYNRGLDRLSALASIREAVTGTSYPDVSVLDAYSDVLDSVVQLGREVSTAITDRDLLRDGTVIEALSQTKESISLENAILSIAAEHNRFPGNLLGQAQDAQASSAAAFNNYRANASPAQTQLYSDTVSGVEVDSRERIKSQAFVRAAGGQPLNIDQQQLAGDGDAVLEYLRTMEESLLGDLRAAADAQTQAATEAAWRDSAIVFAALLVALALMLVVTRSLLKPLRVLRREALEVANRRLPASVQRILADPDPVEAAKHAVDPVPVFTQEETGQLARSFEQMQEQAVRMATEQALLRDNINSIFVNLSRRSQALVERQLSLIDRLEQDEQDPDQLASLFELDHLATRMRRNSESLLVLSGTGLSRQLSRPVPASEVVGAAVSEVEHYARIEVASAPEVAVQGRAVSDLVHLIAELLDNATFFSEPEKKVTVRMAMTRKKELAIQITDRGVGMSEEEIDAANERLSDPPDLDVAVTRRMGLYVVARLAKRHNVVVRLRDNEDIDGGLIARINVPVDLVQPIGASPSQQRLSATSTTSTTTALAGDGAGSTPTRNSGIAGAFTGNMPRLRTEPPGSDTQQERTPQEVASYPPFTAEHPPGGLVNNGAPEDRTGTTSPPGELAPPEPNGVPDGQPVTLFGSPLPESGGTGVGDYPPSGGTDTGVPDYGGERPAWHPIGYEPGNTQTSGGGRDPQTPQEEVDPNVDAPTERLPIYEAVLSQWFEAADTGSQRQMAAGTGAPVGAESDPTSGTNGNGNGTTSAEPTPWVSPGDEGWQAAQALLDDDSSASAQTTAGLPKRVPKAHLVPGSAAPTGPDSGGAAAAPPAPETTGTPGTPGTTATTAPRASAGAPAAPSVPPRSADAVRGRMSSFQQGVRRGRHALIEAYAGDQAGSEQGRRNEEQE